ncbi:hypothetical protein [Pararhodobacter zhoushanensis]|uniref:DUF3137 domain-containing protein n=1 Tax=Pararhodobacter zhoushanensis TaxID=2479545 RepID=A0ABT3GW49_9RHOB|nr:hypothetical protein [Pararhodobacter zhoushanensis]MCW1931774.1 hypothetical protein [Pararhodobacter zhoushanensis]
MTGPAVAPPPRGTLLGLLARLGGPHRRGRQFGSLGRPRQPGPVLPEEQLAGLQARLGPVLARLDAERRAWIRQTERELRLAAGAAALVGLGLGWSMGGPVTGLALMLGGAGFALLLLMGRAQGTTREAAKQAIAEVLAPELIGLSPVPPDARARRFTPERLAGWGLPGPVHTVTVDECLTGERAGFSVSIARVGMFFGNENNRTAEVGGGACFVVAELTAPGEAEGDATVVIPQDAALAFRTAPSAGRPPAAATGDADFDARYRVHGDPSPLGPEARAAFAALEAVARADPTCTRDVTPGTGLRPFVILRPGRVTVLTPLALFDGAFEPPPFWAALDAASLTPRFASDLLILNDHLAAATILTKGLFR